MTNQDKPFNIDLAQLQVEGAVREKSKKKERAYFDKKGNVLVGQYGIARAIKDGVTPPLFRHQVNKSMVLCLQCARSISRLYGVQYYVIPYMLQSNECTNKYGKPTQRWKKRNWYCWSHTELLFLRYYLDKATDWITKQKLLDLEFEMKRKHRLAELDGVINKAEEDIKNRESQLAEIDEMLKQKKESKI
jgi:hypothetical protein